MSSSLRPGSPIIWQKSSKSLSDGACVEVGTRGQMVVVRDSKDPDGPVLNYTRREWDAFLDGAKKGEFDHYC